MVTIRKTLIFDVSRCFLYQKKITLGGQNNHAKGNNLPATVDIQSFEFFLPFY